MLRSRVFGLLLTVVLPTTGLLGNLTGYASYTCPQGFDCWHQNSCPNVTIQCPQGYFCADPSNFGVTAGGDSELFRDNPCPLGVACDTPRNAETCASGKWCDEYSTEGVTCDVGASCDEGAYIQIAPLLLVVSIVASVIIFVLIKQQTSFPPEEKVVVNEQKENTDSFQRINFKATDLTVSVGEKRILESLNATFNAGEVTAIMGPSGAGKSTIMNALMGTIPYQGAVEINGEMSRTAQSKVERMIGFVPQDDIMDSLLTPREILTYCAKTRLPASYSAEDIREIVSNVLFDLGILERQNTAIGDEYRRGLSGGEKKRVNIAMELVANPSVLFLDEPTSGLDASASEEIIGILSKLAAGGRCIIMVIHQPRYESFSQFNKVLLLSKSKGVGSCCYFGPALKAAPYFAKMDPVLQCATRSNPANHILDIVSGVFDHVEAKERRNPRIKSTELRQEWLRRRQAFQMGLAAEKKSSDQKGDDHEQDGDTNNSSSNNSMQARGSPSLCRAAATMMARSYRLQMRDKASFKIFGFLCFIMAIILSTGFTPYLQENYTNTYEVPLDETLSAWCPPFLSCDLPNDIGLQQLLFFINVALGAATMMVGARLFKSNILMTRREARAGVPIWLQGAMQMTINMLPLCFFTLIFVGWWVALGHPGSAVGWFLICLSIAFASSGVGYIVSLGISRDFAYSACMVVALLLAAFNGVQPKLPDIPNGIRWVWDLSFTRWAGEATYTHYTQHLVDQGQNVQRGANIIGYKIGRLYFDCVMMGILGFLVRIIACLLLVKVAHKWKWKDLFGVLLASCCQKSPKNTSAEDDSKFHSVPDAKVDMIAMDKLNNKNKTETLGDADNGGKDEKDDAKHEPSEVLVSETSEAKEEREKRTKTTVNSRAFLASLTNHD